jgi:CheY-like chemotaxis protein
MKHKTSINGFVLSTVFLGALTGCVGYVDEPRPAVVYTQPPPVYVHKFAYPTFMLTDLKMPGADGFEVLKHLKSNPAWAIIPTVVLSASTDPDAIRTSYLLGASSCHVKPHSFQGLRTQLKILHDYWITCEVPEVDSAGKQVQTDSRGKLGERFLQPTQSRQTKE